MTPLVKEMVALDEDIAIACVWFDVGTMARFEFAWSELPGSRLPFEHCAIVGRDGRGDRFLVVATQADDTAILLAAWAIQASGIAKTPLFAVHMDEDAGGCRIGGVEGEDEITKDRAAPFVGILAGFLRAANPTGYRAAPKANSITNKRRIANGKAPLIYDWRTVVIAPATQNVAHASPRQHERRGHWRITSAGKRVWVRNCIVGDASRGTVFHDYKVMHGGAA